MATPRKSPLPESLTATRPPPAAPSTSSRSRSACIASIFDFNSLACFIRPRKSGIEVTLVLRDFGQILGAGGSIVGRLPYIDDFGAGKALQYRLHPRIGAHSVLQFRLARIGLGADRRHAGLGGHRNHPAPAGPIRNFFGKLADQ